MNHRALRVGVAIAWLASVALIVPSGNPNIVTFTAPLGLVVIAASAIIHYNDWGTRFRAFIGLGILVLVTGDLVPYWVIAYLSNAPYGILNPVDMLAGFVAGLIAVTVGWYVLMAAVDFEGGHNGQDGKDTTTAH